MSFDEKMKYDHDLCRDIDYILRKIACKAPPQVHPEVVKLINKNSSLEDLKDQLCEFTSHHVNFEFKP
jgi:hypothetical protein